MTKVVHEIFSEARRAKGLELDQVFRQTGIPIRFLSALEIGNFRVFGGRVYVLRYARQYGDFLGITDEAFLQDVSRAWEIYAFRNALRFRPLSPFRRSVKTISGYRALIGGVLGIILPIAGYFFYQLSLLLSAPDLFVTNPPEAISVTAEQTVTIRGILGETARLSVNRRPVALSENGGFEARLYLTPGLNTIDIDAVNVSGREVTEKRFIFYEPNR